VPGVRIEPEDGPTLADLGESGVLARVFPRLPSAAAVEVGPGDDAAVVTAADGRVVATTDLMVEGRDFRPEWSTAYDIGWKSAAQNLADIAAMGAVPTALLVGLVAPGSTPVAWVEGLAEGLAAACAGTGASVAGGDLSSGDHIVVSVTALGDLQGRPAVLRSGARPGDVVAVAGRLGWSAAGLALLQVDLGDAAPELVVAHLRPDPPYAAGPAAALAGATAMLDVSDGLVRDAGRIASASEVTIDLNLAALQSLAAHVLAAAKALGDNDLATRWVLTGGEDHALVACFPAGAVPPAFAVVGSVVAPAGRPVLLAGLPPETVVGSASGWDHFSG
jgi:thiamine-monophosphate kinase